MVVSAFVVKGSPDLAAERVDDFCRTGGVQAAHRVFFPAAPPMNPSGQVLKNGPMERASKDEERT